MEHDLLKFLLAQAKHVESTNPRNLPFLEEKNLDPEARSSMIYYKSAAQIAIRLNLHDLAATYVFKAAAQAINEHQEYDLLSMTVCLGLYDNFNVELINNCVHGMIIYAAKYPRVRPRLRELIADCTKKLASSGRFLHSTPTWPDEPAPSHRLPIT